MVNGRLIHLFIICSDHLKFLHFSVQGGQGRLSLIRRAGAGNMLIVNTDTNNNKILHSVVSYTAELTLSKMKHKESDQASSIESYSIPSFIYRL